MELMYTKRLDNSALTCISPAIYILIGLNYLSHIGRRFYSSNYIIILSVISVVFCVVWSVCGNGLCLFVCVCVCVWCGPCVVVCVFGQALQMELELVPRRVDAL